MSNLENDFESNGDTHLETSSSTVTTTSDISTNYIDEIQNVINEWIPQFPWDISNDEDNQVVMENGLSGEQEQDIINMKEKSQIEDETIVEKKKFTTNATGGAADDGTDGSTIEASNEVLIDEMSLVTTQQDIFQSSEGPSEVLYQQGALAYASATGDLLFLMTLLSSKLSIRDDSIHKTNSFNEKQGMCVFYIYIMFLLKTSLPFCNNIYILSSFYPPLSFLLLFLKCRYKSIKFNIYI